jgi:hypothetical protein
MRRTLDRKLPLFSTLILALLSACQSQTSPASPATQLSQAEIRSQIVSSFKSQYEHPHRIDSTITTSDQTILVSIEFVPPDHYLISSQDNYYPQMIIIGETVYGLANNQWAKLPINPDQLINPNALKEMEASLQDMQYLGQETLEDRPVNVFQFNSRTTIGDNPVDQQNKLWVWVTDGLPYKLEIDGQIATMDARTNTIQGVKALTVQTMIYDPAIKIEAPLP